MDIRKVIHATRTVSTRGLTFSERVVQNILILGFMFGSSAAIVAVLFAVAYAFKWVLMFIMPEIAAGITAMITTSLLALCVFGALMDTRD